MKKRKLISMTDFVLDENFKTHSRFFPDAVVNYALFLKQPLKLEMFVPCDEDGNVLKEPVYTNPNNMYYDENYIRKYQQAKEKVLFEGFGVKYFDLRKKSYLIFNNDFVLDLTFKHSKNIESLIHLNIELTPTAIKQIEVLDNFVTNLKYKK